MEQAPSLFRLCLAILGLGHGWRLIGFFPADIEIEDNRAPPPVGAGLDKTLLSGFCCYPAVQFFCAQVAMC